eukprot:CAMPEP_0201654046 /NCGR_PEP_ID=MMETSP0493-20130528/45298_1 /ASSEMBLY_ACC=CAM_ASM_000838 /TAXON_ID=420259 /ORGANISM="Thalassiosira gravida, Strain GMp14c1" /LENGTH=120 /DNA_ID=CAMNT_0048130595 /DNA_START=176 /DNA_END=538 /DNA_ORIENTATION=-
MMASEELEEPTSRSTTSTSSAASSSAAASPVWTNTTASDRPPPIEDHRGITPAPNPSSTGTDDLLAPVCTLDEPVSETIMRDVRAVGAKLKAVLIPLDRNVSVFRRIAIRDTVCAIVRFT